MSVFGDHLIGAKERSSFMDEYVYIRDENGKIIGRTYGPSGMGDRQVSGGSSSDLESVAPDSGRETKFSEVSKKDAANIALGLLISLPPWAPYAAVVLALLFAPAGMLSTAFGWGTLIYVILHTVLFVKCRKLTGDKKYLPLYIGFGLFVLTFRLFSLPAIAFLGYWLWKMTKGSSTKDSSASSKTN